MKFKWKIHHVKKLSLFNLDKIRLIILAPNGFYFFVTKIDYSYWGESLKNIEKGKGKICAQIKSQTISYLNVFSDGFGSFRDSVSGEFSWEDELDSWLNLSGWKSSSLVESNELWSFSGDSVESVVDERVHDVHGFLWDSDIWVDLFKDLVDIDWESLNSSSSGFSVSASSGGGSLGHFSCLNIIYKIQPSIF